MTFIPKPPYIISIVYYGDSSMKYKNKDGIELSYTGNDIHTLLVKEVIGEAIKLLDFPPSYSGCEKSMNKCKEFLKVNFNIEEK